MTKTLGEDPLFKKGFHSKARSRSGGLFVTGTDTGVGKSLVSCGLVRLARLQGLNAVGVKPVETGCDLDQGELVPEDGMLLHRASEHALSLKDCAPFRFSLPASPARAAAAEGREIHLPQLVAHIRSISRSTDFTLVEGAGGLMVPVNGTHLFIDLIHELGYPVLLVARTRLGTINHTLLSVTVLQQRGIEIAGIVLSKATAQMGPEEEHTPGDIACLLPAIPVAVLPFLSADTRSDPDALARVLSGSVEGSIWKTWIGLES